MSFSSQDSRDILELVAKAYPPTNNIELYSDQGCHAIAKYFKKSIASTFSVIQRRMRLCPFFI